MMLHRWKVVEQMSNAKITLFGFYRWFKIVNLDLFSEMVLPDGIDRNRLINTILLRGGEFETQYSDADFIKGQIGIVSNNWFDTFNRWKIALETEYAPLENYDRMEEWTDDSNTNSSNRITGQNNTNATSTVSAYNSDSLVLDNGDNNYNATESDANGNTSSNNKHVGRVHGNIGVTTSDQMLQSHMITREKWGNLYEHIADVFLRELTIPVY